MTCKSQAAWMIWSRLESVSPRGSHDHPLAQKAVAVSQISRSIRSRWLALARINRVRDPADERQVKVSLTAAGRILLENDLGKALVGACGSGEEFYAAQKNVVRLRDNLRRNTRGKQDAT